MVVWQAFVCGFVIAVLLVCVLSFCAVDLCGSDSDPAGRLAKMSSVQPIACGQATEHGHVNKTVASMRTRGSLANREEKNMAGQIRITPDQMRSRANEYRVEAENVQGVIRKMDSLLSQLQSEWEGESSRAYASRFTELRPGFVQAKNLIDEIARALDSTAATLEQTDAQIAAGLR